MAYKFKNLIGKKLIASILVLSFIFPVSYLPTFTPRAQAIAGVGDVNIESVPVILEFVLKSIGTAMAQRMVDDMVKETIKWANSGFEDNPAYVTDFEGFLVNTADAIAGEFIEGNDLNFLCSPFQNSVRLSLRHQYNTGSLGNQNQFQCTLSEISGNIEGFFDGNFSSGGGWDAWFSMTQNPANNPYGAYLEAKIELDSRIAQKLNIEREQLSWNQGFLSWSECVKTDKETGKCLVRGPVKTPGSVIHSQLNKSLGSGMSRLISAESLDQIVGAFASGLLERYVFGSKGLFASNTSESISSGREIIDVDNDNIPDGWDYNNDGQLDMCHHGLVDQNSSPSNSNCIGSRNAGNSPYFIPICENLTETVDELNKYYDFATRNTFRKEYSNTWFNRTTRANGAVENLENTISRYEIMEYDPTLFALGEYTKRLDKRTGSLAKDGDLGGSNVLGLGTSDGDAREMLIKDTKNILEYLEKFQSVMGRCDDPNEENISNIPVPVFEPIEETPEDNDTRPGDTEAF